MSDKEEIILEYSSEPLDPPGFFATILPIIGSIISGIVGALIESAKKFAVEALQMFTLERLVGAGTQYLREQAGTWLTKTLVDAGHQEWIANFLHAFGYDLEDLLSVGKTALDSGFKVLTEEISSTLKEAKLLDKGALDLMALVIGTHKDDVSHAIVSSGQTTQRALFDHGSLIAGAYKDWTMFSSRNFSSEEEKMRMHLAAIFTDTPDRIAERTKIEQEQGFSAMSDTSQDEIERRIPGIVKKLGSIVRPVQDVLNNLILSLRDSIYYIMVPALPVSYEKAGYSAASALGASIGMGMTAHGLAVAADLIHPLKATAIPQIAAFLCDMAGFGAIARYTWYTDLGHFLGTPYRHYSLRFFRPTLPSTRDLMELYAKNLILEDDFDLAMQYHGYRDPWIKAWKKDIYRHARIHDLSLMINDATMSTSSIYRSLRGAEYSPEDSDVLAKQILKKSLSSYLDAYRKQLMYLFKKGYMSEEQFDAQLDLLELTSEASFLTKKIARFSFIEDYTDTALKMFQDMYDKDLLDDDDFETSLAGLGIVTEKRTILMSSLKVKKTARVAKEEKALIKTQIRKQQQILIDTYVLAYRAGTLDEDGLLAALRFAGIENELATLTVGLEKQKRQLTETKKAAATKESALRAIVKKYEQGYVDLFRRDLIDEDELAEYLKDLGLEDDYIMSVVETERLKKIKPEATGIG